MTPLYKAIAVGAAVVLAVGVAPQPSYADPSPAATALSIDPGMAAAMRRDLKLTDAQIATRLRTEAIAPAVEKSLRAKLGKTFGGAWIPPGKDKLTVAVTTAAAADEVRAAGAEPAVVARSLSELDAARQKLDRHAAKAGKDVRSWHADPVTNSLVIAVKPGAEAAARKFAAASDAGPVRVETAGEFRLLQEIRGGDQFQSAGGICSVGFAVAGGFVTAGHCVGAGNTTTGYDGTAQGSFANYSFPVNDFAFVRTNSNWWPQPYVNNYGGGNVLVAGSTEGVVGSSTCRSGRTSGWHCGSVLSLNNSVQLTNANDVIVDGLTHTSACSEAGDSGGPFLGGNQAQGTLTGSSQGDCQAGGDSFFQPVNEALSTFNLSLVTTAGGGRPIVSNWNNKCVDIPFGSFDNEVKLEMFSCNNGDNQKWRWLNGALQTANNKCLDIPGGSRDNGVRLQLWECNGNPAQQFVLTGAGDLVNPQSGKCVDISGRNAEDRAQIIQYDCRDTDNQKWRLG